MITSRWESACCTWTIAVWRWYSACLRADSCWARSSIDWIWSESTIRPIFTISAFEPSSTSVASFWRSVTISSTVIEPAIERRWPAKMRPASTDIWSSSERKRWAALTIDSGSLPTLNAITAFT